MYFGKYSSRGAGKEMNDEVGETEGGREIREEKREGKGKIKEEKKEE